jgi:hypothetical protein
MRGIEPPREEEEATPSAHICGSRYVCYPWLVVASVYVDLAYREVFIVLSALGSPRPTDDKPSARMVSVIGDFGPKVDYIPFEQGSRTSHK